MENSAQNMTDNTLSHENILKVADALATDAASETANRSSEMMLERDQLRTLEDKSTILKSIHQEDGHSRYLIKNNITSKNNQDESSLCESALEDNCTPVSKLEENYSSRTTKELNDNSPSEILKKEFKSPGNISNDKITSNIMPIHEDLSGTMGKDATSGTDTQDNGGSEAIMEKLAKDQKDSQCLQDGKVKLLKKTFTQDIIACSVVSEDDTLIREEKDPEGNPKDTLDTKIANLETELKQVNDYYEKLSKKVNIAKSKYEKEREDCEDITNVAKRNVENQVSKILDLLRKKRELNHKIDNQEEKNKKEEEETRTRLFLEEEKLRRNVVILQNEKFERDQLLKKIQVLEEELASKERQFDEALKQKREEILYKYESLLSALSQHTEVVSEHAVQLSQAQQIAALKDRQQLILDTQSKYKASSRLMLRILDQNKQMKMRAKNMKLDLDVISSLAEILAAKSEKTKKKLISSLEFCKKRNEQKAQLDHKDDMNEKRQELEKLRNRYFRAKDYARELEEVLADQENYKMLLQEEKEKRNTLQEKFSCIANAAEFVAKQKSLEFIGLEDPKERSDFFQDLSAILLEEDDENHDQFLKESFAVNKDHKHDDVFFYKKGCLGLVDKVRPLSSMRSRKDSLYPGKTKAKDLTARKMDLIEKKILSDVGLLGKYGSKKNIPRS
ncbi:trichohyalin-like [Stegodyphus dumicola]|uniref:trichohyalin-like n=1 Tax=Stegodyphus dumicola TaxID=202533 RepID=UPI0015B21CFE|nr:trichohyalin-like [Stegodyphus dumicola]